MSRARTELVHCPNCGEDYAATYRRCPFCNARANRRQEEGYDVDSGYEEAPRRQGGKRLASGGSDPGPIIKYILIALAVVAALALLCLLVIPKLFGGGKAPAEATPSAAASEAAALPTSADEPDPSTEAPPEYDYLLDLPTVDAEGNIIPAPSGAAPLTSQAPASQTPAASPAPAASQAPATPAPAAAGGARLSKTDFSITAKYPDPVTLKVTGGEAASWSSNKTSVATVSETGKVTGVSDGTAKITCTLTSGKTLTCTVHVSGKSGQAPASGTSSGEAPASQAPSNSDARLTYAGRAVSEFTISASNPDPIPLKVSGGTASSWSSSNDKVAAVSSNGTVTGKSDGKAKITCTLSSGETLTCTVLVRGF